MGNRRLYILRHAEAAYQAGTDRERPLTEAGRHAAVSLGLRMKREGVAPDFVLCSPALRTKQTLDVLDIDLAGPLLYPPSLYNASASELYERIKTVPPSCESVLLIAHNPGLGDLVRFLTGEAMCFAPGALAVVECPAAGWDAVMPGQNQLADVIMPRAV